MTENMNIQTAQTQLMEIARQEVWNKTPFSYIRTGTKLTLLQQDTMLMVSDYLQQYIKSYFDLGLHKTGMTPRPLFTKYLLEHGIPPFKIYLADMGINPSHYKSVREAIEQMNMLVEHQEIDEQGKATGGTIFSPVFTKFRVPPTGDYYRKRDDQGEVIVESARHNGYIEVEINKDVAQYAFDMSQGYATHPKLIARYATKQSTPKMYFKLQELMGKDKRVKVKLPVTEIKKALGFEPFKDEKTGEWIVPYAKFAHFKTKVLDAVKDDLDRMARENHTDITFDYEAVYLNGRKRGDPDYIEFTIMSTDLGIGYSLLTKKDTPATGEAKERKREAVEQELFVEQAAVAQLYTQQDYDAGAGEEQWRQLLSSYDGPAKSLLLRARYLGLRGRSFYVSISKADDAQWDALGREWERVYAVARPLLSIPRLAPAIVKTIQGGSL